MSCRKVFESFFCCCLFFVLFFHRTKIGLNPKFLQCLYFRNSVSFLGAGVNCSVPPHLQGAVVNLSIPPRLQGSYHLFIFLNNLKGFTLLIFFFLSHTFKLLLELLRNKLRNYYSTCWIDWVLECLGAFECVCLWLQLPLFCGTLRQASSDLPTQCFED